MSETKAVKTRDEATAILRKLGINKADYNKFIFRPSADSKFIVNVEAAKKSLASAPADGKPLKATDLALGLAPVPTILGAAAKAATPPPAVVVPPKPAETPRAASKKTSEAAKASRITVASRMRELIKAGKTDEQVWKIVQPEFKLDDAKKRYPAWYRAEIKRKNLI